jgi:hypothetical protein
LAARSSLFVCLILFGGVDAIAPRRGMRIAIPKLNGPR